MPLTPEDRRRGNAGKGRPKGVPNKLPGDVKALILAALDEVGGRSYLVEQAKANPVAFLSLVGKLLPRDDRNVRPFVRAGNVNLSVSFIEPSPERYADTKLIDVTPEPDR